MKIISRIVAVLLFILFFFFALKNTQEVTLQFLWGYNMHGPLVGILLGFFVLGAVLGVLAMTPTVFRHKRALSRNKKTIASMQKEAETQQLAKTQPPPPDNITGA